MVSYPERTALHTHLRTRHYHNYVVKEKIKYVGNRGIHIKMNLIAVLLNLISETA